MFIFIGIGLFVGGASKDLIQESLRKAGGERTDREIHEAWRRYFIQQLVNSKEPDKPVMGCMCHLLSLRQVVRCFDLMLCGLDLPEDVGHAMDSIVDTETLREVARSHDADPVALINEDTAKVIAARKREEKFAFWNLLLRR